VIHDDIHPPLACESADLRGEVLGSVVDPGFSAQLPGSAQFLGAARRDQDARAEHRGDLNGRRGHAASGGMNEHGFPRTELRAGDQHVPGGEKHEWCRCRLLKRETLRLREDVAGGDHDEVGAGAVAVLAEDSVPATEVVVSPRARFA
jgi:hypothetical protein